MKINKDKLNEQTIKKLEHLFKQILKINHHLKFVQLVVVANDNRNYGFTTTRKSNIKKRGI